MKKHRDKRKKYMKGNFNVIAHSTQFISDYIDINNIFIGKTPTTIKVVTDED